MYQYNNREEIPENYKWDLSDFFANDEEMEKCYEDTVKTINSFKNFELCTKDPKKLFEFLEKRTLAESEIDKLYIYSYLKNDENLGISKNIERKNKTRELYSILNINTSFFDTELLKLNNEEYNKIFKDYEKLNEYKSLLDKMYRNKAHTLSENEENIVSTLVSSMNNFSSISSTMLNSEHNYGKIKLENGKIKELTPNNYSSFMQNKNRNIRKKASKLLNTKLNEYKTTSANLLNSYIKGNTSVAKIHKFDNAWERKLFNLNLNDKVFKTLVNVVENNTDVLKKYNKLRKKILGLKKLYNYDTGIDLCRSTKEYTIEEAQEIIKKALKPLGKKYLEQVNILFDKRCIDYIAYKGKSNGGYSFSSPCNLSKILINYNEDLNSISVLIHELGHGVHNNFLKENNHLAYRSQNTIVSEVASLTNECLLSSYLISHGTTKKEKLAGIENMMRIIITNLFTATREGKIEENMYNLVSQGGSITKDYMDTLVNESLIKYYGNTVKFEYPNSWITRSHYYSNFYLYSYALSISVAIKISSDILNGNQKTLENYIKFLSIGSDKWTDETFNTLGINLENNETYKSAIKYFDDLINTYEKIYYELEVKENE